MADLVKRGSQDFRAPEGMRAPRPVASSMNHLTSPRAHLGQHPKGQQGGMRV
jgi:hypothetical protein